MEGVSDTVMEEMGESIVYWIRKWWLGKKDFRIESNGWILVPFPPPLQQLDTAYAIIIAIFSLVAYFRMSILGGRLAVLALLCCVCGGFNRLNINKIKLIKFLEHVRVARAHPETSPPPVT